MIHIAVDGSCLGNPGRGAFALVADDNGMLFERAIPFAATTNNEMELRGLLEALLYVAGPLADRGPVTIHCDSQYAVNGYNDWMSGWKAKGWHKKGGLAHAEIWKLIDQAKAAIATQVTVVWIRAHQNNGSLNDRVDALANACAHSGTPVNGPALQAQEEASPAAGGGSPTSCNSTDRVAAGTFTEIQIQARLGRNWANIPSLEIDLDSAQKRLKIFRERYPSQRHRLVVKTCVVIDDDFTADGAAGQARRE